MPTPADAYADLVRRSKDVTLLRSAAGVLEWDQQTYMPKAGAALRGDQNALLASLAHRQATDPAIGELLAAVEGTDFVKDPASVEAANVREWRHGFDRATKLPGRLVEELARVTARAQSAWAEARSKDDYPAFRPWLEQVLALKREEADAVGYTAHRYDALLDEYEPGTTAADVTKLFAELAAEVAPLAKLLGESGKTPRAEVLHREYPLDRQRLFAEAAAAAIGYDFAGGRLDVSAHPFSSGFGPGDSRITTRFNPRFFSEAFFGVLHEAGHSIYEQGLPADRFGTPCGTYCSLGIHESQSRLWENQVGRGRPFWDHFYPRLRQAFPGTLDDVTADEFYLAVNEVKPSLIRVEADEVTYNLHVALRFELELALLGGDLSPADLPGAWNERFEQLIGLKVPSDREGCLQDVHWSFGGIGYFPTYTLGNLYAAQLMDAAANDLGGAALADGFRRGDFAPLKGWLNRSVHAHGRRFRAAELCRRATGEPPSAKPFVRYLKGKFAGLYGVC